MANKASAADHSRTKNGRPRKANSNLPEYVSMYLDRHGKRRYRYRRKGYVRMINAAPGSPEFKAIYNECVNYESPRLMGPKYPTHTVVYFIANENGSVKIGWTTNLRNRLVDLRCASSSDLDVVAWVRGGEVLERHFHRAFASQRMRGEWFKRNAALDALIAELATHSVALLD